MFQLNGSLVGLLRDLGDIASVQIRNVVTAVAVYISANGMESPRKADSGSPLTSYKETFKASESHPARLPRDPQE